MSGRVCPRCNSPVTTTAAPDLTLDACGRCGGIWLDNEGSQTAAGGLSSRTIEVLIKVAASATYDADTSGAMACPDCATALARTHYNGVEVDYCPAHGSFFDRGELARVSRGAAAGGSTPGASTPGGFHSAPSQAASDGFRQPPPVAVDYAHYSQYSQPTNARLSGLAIAGFVFAFLCSIIGLVMSWKAYNDIQRSQGQLKGEGLAMAGMVISVLFMIIGVFMRVSR